MKYLYSWLKELYPAIPTLTDLEPLLAQLGHDIEHIEPVTYPGVRVAEIIRVTKHPNADNLSLVQITTGKETHDVVCGAPNLEIGQKVAYAAVGSTLPCGITLRQAKIRGEVSDGMLCAADELGLGNDHQGLLPLPTDAPLGEGIERFVQSDARITLEITPNRGDVLSHYGLARDIKAATERSLLHPALNSPSYTPDGPSLTIETLHPDATAIGFGLVTTEKESVHTPLLMAARLYLLGQRSINLVTDITNYLLLEYGQPLHAYDASKLTAPYRFGVRRAHDRETLVGINNKVYELTPQNLVITHADKAVAIAGVHGGSETKAETHSQTVIFEAGLFHPKAVRLSAQGLQLSTESAHRFARSIDPELRLRILKHAQALFCQITDGKAYEPVDSTQSIPSAKPAIRLTNDHLQRFIGSSLSSETSITLLTSLGCQTSHDGDTLIITPPSWRPDLTIVEDIDQELVRLTGIHHLSKQLLPATVPQWKRSRYWRYESVKDTLIALGAYEIMTYPFMNAAEIELFGASEAVEIAQPPIEDKQYMRTSLIPGSLQAVATNPEIPTLVFFEMGKVFTPSSESLRLAITLASNNPTENDAWWQNFFERLRFPVSSWMGRVATINETMRSYYKIRKNSVTALELPIEDFFAGKQPDIPQVIMPELGSITYETLSRFQQSRRDIAIIVDVSYDATQIARAIKDLDPTIAAVELFDTYRSDSLGSGKHSLAYHVYYQPVDHTLTDDEINTIHTKVTEYIKEHYDGIIR